MYARACMYHTCVKPSSQLLYAHAQVVLSQQSSKFIFTGKGNSGKKKRSVAQEWARTWVWCIADHCLCHRANGALAALDCKFGSYTVDCCSESAGADPEKNLRGGPESKFCIMKGINSKNVQH